jgi:phosphoglycolate phosphatase-like HAD superfamily hydrolase
MTLFRAPSSASLDPQKLGLIFDLDGVVVDVTHSYRKGYVHAITHYMTGLGLPPESDEGIFTLEDVHLLKTHKDFNAPHTMLDFLVQISLVAALQNPGVPLTPEKSGIGRWIREGLIDRRLDQWQDTLTADLDERDLNWLRSTADRDKALALCHECYVGSDRVFDVYGHEPQLNVSGLCSKDSFLLNPDRSPPGAPMGVYTGRVYGEARFLMNRMAFFSAVDDAHICTIDRGYRKPDADALEYLCDALGTEEILYIGDVPADRAAALAFRAKRPQGRLWLAQVLATPDTAHWSEADFVSSEPESVLDSLGM